MTWNGSPSFSYGVDTLLNQLSPHGREAGTATFPGGMDRAGVRFQGKETVKQWFNRCVDTFMPEGIPRGQVEGNLAVFACVRWKRNDELTYASVNILKTECGLQDYYDLSEEDLDLPAWKDYCRPHYLRLDLDYGTLGPIGTHPLPHLHFSPSDPPRFALDSSQSGNVIVDFLEFIYRHFYPGEWLGWAERAWDEDYHGKKREPRMNPFRTIVSAFANQQWEFLSEHSADLSDIVSVLKKAKDGMFDLKMNVEHRRLMTFPDWHE